MSRRVAKHKPDLRPAVENRRQQVAALRIRGLAIAEIVNALAAMEVINPETEKPYTYCAVQKDLVFLRRQWREAAAADTAEHQARLLAELQEIKRRCWKKDDMPSLLRAWDGERKLLGLDVIKIAPVAADGEMRVIELALDDMTDEQLRALAALEGQVNQTSVIDAEFGPQEAGGAEPA